MAMLHTKPAADGFAMPAEFAPHSATVLIWPVRPGSWGRDPSAAQQRLSRRDRARSPRARRFICLLVLQMLLPPEQPWRTLPG